MKVISFQIPDADKSLVENKIKKVQKDRFSRLYKKSRPQILGLMVKALIKYLKEEEGA